MIKKTGATFAADKTIGEKRNIFMYTSDPAIRTYRAFTC